MQKYFHIEGALRIGLINKKKNTKEETINKKKTRIVMTEDYLNDERNPIQDVPSNLKKLKTTVY